MERCWAETPAMRPEFPSIRKIIRSLNKYVSFNCFIYLFACDLCRFLVTSDADTSDATVLTRTILIRTLRTPDISHPIHIRTSHTSYTFLFTVRRVCVRNVRAQNVCDRYICVRGGGFFCGFCGSSYTSDIFNKYKQLLKCYRLQRKRNVQHRGQSAQTYGTVRQQSRTTRR